MSCKDIKIIYSDLIKRRDKLLNKKTWLDRRITEITDTDIIIKLVDECSLIDSKSRDINKQINKLTKTYKFLK